MNQQTQLTITLAKATDVLLTLRYALETFDQTCHCRACYQCTDGRDDLQRAIDTIGNCMAVYS